MPARPSLCLLGLPLVVALMACRPDLDPATGPGEMPYAFLRSHVEEVLRDVQDARNALGENRPADGVTPLDEASVGLRKVLGYYIPLLEIRFRVARAMELTGTNPAVARVALDSAQSIFEGVASSHGEQLGREMQEPLARIEEARTALESGQREEARRILRRLHQQLELLYYRGEIVLEGSELDTPPRDPPD